MAENEFSKLDFLNNGLAQIALVVKDLDATVEQYYRCFGIGPWHFYTYGKPLVPRMTRNGKPTTYKMRVALSYLGPMRIELIEHLEGDTVYQEFINQHGYGVHHLGVLVDDMEDAMRRANEAGFHVTMDGAGFGPDDDGHYAYLDTENSIGTTIELIARPKRRKTPEKIYPPDSGTKQQ
ncbi:MAG TPA: VOC family protein [Spirochaetia bacterium]|nr:VOC family protein [Spirochaetia bacterium]